MEIHQIIREARLKKGLTQLQVATALGLKSSQFVFLIETGRSKLPYDKIKPIAKILGLKPEFLMSVIVMDLEAEVRREAK